MQHLDNWHVFLNKQVATSSDSRMAALGSNRPGDYHEKPERRQVIFELNPFARAF